METIGDEPGYEAQRYQDAAHGELDRFTKRGPLCTLLLFAIAQAALVVQTLMDMLDTFEVSARFKDVEGSYAMEIIGATSLPIMAITYIGSMFAQALTAHIPRLLGQGQRDVAQHVLSDIMRLCLLLSIVFPVCFMWAIKPILKLISCPAEIVDKAFRYCVPVLIGCPWLTLFSLVVGFLLGIGKNWWALGTRCIPYIVQACVFTPALLWGLNITTDHCKWSQVVAEGLAAIVIMWLLFKGTFDLKIPLRMFCEKPVWESLNTIALAMPTFFQFFCFAFPPTMVMKTMSDIEPDRAADIEASFGFWSKATFFIATIHVTFSNAFLVAGGHAYGMKNYRRFLKILGWGLVVGWTPVILCSVVMAARPAWIAGLFLHDSQLEYACKMLPIPFYTFWIQTIDVFSTSILEVVNRPRYPMIFSVLQIIVLCVGCVVVKNRVHGKSHNVMFIYVINDFIQVACYGITALCYLVPLFRKPDQSEEYEPINSNS